VSDATTMQVDAWSDGEGPAFVEVGGRQLHVRVRDGQHGLRPIAFANSLGTDLHIWDAVIAALPMDVPVLAMDKAGHGRSDPDEGGLAGHAADLAACMDHAGFTEALVCGVSIGGLIAQRLAAERPDLVAALVLSNTGARIGDPASWAARIEAIRRDGLEAHADTVLERWLSPGFAAREPATAAELRRMLLRTPLEGYLASCAALRDADQRESTARLGVPSVCIAGGADQATPPSLLRALVELLPSATLVELPDVGHLPCVESPAAVADIIARLHAGIG